MTPLPNRGNGQDRAGVSPAAFKRPPPTLRRWSADFAPEQTRSPYRPRRLYVGGAVVFFSFANPRQRQCERGRGWAPRNSWQETRGFNHRSTDIKSEGARMNNMADSGAKSSLHRHKVGGGDLVAESKCARLRIWFRMVNPQSPIRNPQSAIRNPQSAIRNPQSAIPNPQSPIRNLTVVSSSTGSIRPGTAWPPARRTRPRGPRLPAAHTRRSPDCRTGQNIRIPRR